MNVIFKITKNKMFKGLLEDLKKRNFSVYGQLLSYITMVLSIVFGIINLFHFSLVIIFSIFCIVQGLIVGFIEMPFLLKIFPMSDGFISLIGRIDDNPSRCIIYFIFSVIQWLSLIVDTTSLIVIAVLFLIISVCFAISAITHQQFTKSTLSIGNNNHLDRAEESQSRGTLQ